MPALNRVEIGYTFYAWGYQKTAVNTRCKSMLLEHAFETLGCRVVGLRTELQFRFATSHRGIGRQERRVIRHHAARRDGTVRDTVMYSILAAEWPEVKRHLPLRLDRLRAAAS